MGPLEEAVELHRAVVARRRDEAAASAARNEEANRRYQLERHQNARRVASQAVRSLLGRVFFPARWEVFDGEPDSNWTRCIANFEGKILIQVDVRKGRYDERRDFKTVMVVRDCRNWQRQIQNPTKVELGEALIAWGIA